MSGSYDQVYTDRDSIAEVEKLHRSIIEHKKEYEDFETQGNRFYLHGGRELADADN